ncbi:MAG: hypothetical protein Q9226_003486 [Calogaya cf. arnoldii]
MTRAPRVHLISLFVLIGLIASTTTLDLPISQGANDAKWRLAVAKGTKLFDQLQSGCYPDTINPINFEGLEAIGFRIGTDQKSQWPPQFQETSVFAISQVNKFKWTSRQAAYWRTSVDRFFFTPWKDETRYYNEYSPRNGLIAAVAATKAAGETLFWSDIAFAMWEAVTAYARKNIKDLRWIAQNAIRDEFTQLIINRLVEGRVAKIKTVEMGEEAFSALLGTPTGAGAVYLLMQHKRQLGLKMITRATVFGQQWAQHGPDVVFEIRDATRMIGAASASATASEHLARLCQSLSKVDNETFSQL